MKALSYIENGRKVIVMKENIDTLGEIYRERARYLLNSDEMFEEMCGKYQSEMTENINVEFGLNARTVCFGALIDIDEMTGHEIRKGERLPVCINNCREFIEIATA